MKYKNETGFILGKIKKDGYFWVEKFFIYPEFRKQGAARELVEYIPQKAKLLAMPFQGEDDKSLDLDNLIKFYESLGFILELDDNNNPIMTRE